MLNPCEENLLILPCVHLLRELNLMMAVSRKTANLLDAEGLSRLQSKEFTEAIHMFSMALDVDHTCIYCLVHRCAPLCCNFSPKRGAAKE